MVILAGCCTDTRQVGKSDAAVTSIRELAVRNSAEQSPIDQSIEMD